MTIATTHSLRRTGEAFTLVELLVVITLIVILLAMMAPALDRAMEAAQRVRCASQLKVIHMSSRQYTDSNRGSFFISRFRAIPHAFNTIHPDNNDAQFRASPGDSTVNWIESLYTVGLAVGPVKTANSGTTVSTAANYRDAAPVWNCPSSGYKSYYTTKYSSLVVGYPYFGGHDRWWNTAQRTPREGRSPVKVTRSEGHWVLAADFTFYAGGWKANHLAYPDSYPSGGNQVAVDGSVEWMDFDRMAFITGWSDAEVPFFWQSDLGPGGLAPNMKSTSGTWPRR